MTELINVVNNDTVLATNFIADSIDPGQEANITVVDDLIGNALRNFDGGEVLVSEAAMHVSKSVQALGDPLMVHKEFFFLFGIAVVFFLQFVHHLRPQYERCSGNAMDDPVECRYRWTTAPPWFSER